MEAALAEARRAAHELNNQLSLVIGYGELLEGMVDGEAAHLADLLNKGAKNAVQTLRRIQRTLHVDAGGPTPPTG